MARYRNLYQDQDEEIRAKKTFGVEFSGLKSATFGGSRAAGETAGDMACLSGSREVGWGSSRTAP